MPVIPPVQLVGGLLIVLALALGASAGSSDVEVTAPGPGAGQGALVINAIPQKVIPASSQLAAVPDDAVKVTESSEAVEVFRTGLRGVGSVPLNIRATDKNSDGKLKHLGPGSFRIYIVNGCLRRLYEVYYPKGSDQLQGFAVGLHNDSHCIPGAPSPDAEFFEVFSPGMTMYRSRSGSHVYLENHGEVFEFTRNATHH